MFVDARSLPADEQLAADICIIGGGPAGIALALALAPHGFQIVLAESGDLTMDPRTQSLNDGDSVGLAYRISDSRPRYFGGAGNHWAGNCRALDETTFMRREWVPHSGWPFPGTELNPYYERARVLCGVLRHEAGVEDMRAAGAEPVPWFAPLETAVWHVSEAIPFGETFYPTLAAASNITVLLNANLTALASQPDGNGIAAARFTTLGDTRFQVLAQSYVLACGGLENARLLLAMASERHPNGVANQHDLVGRFFMEHPEICVGVLIPSRPERARLGYLIGTTRGGLAEGYRVSDSFQESAQICGAAFWPVFGLDYSDLTALEDEFAIEVQPAILNVPQDRTASSNIYSLVTVSLEQAPNPESRVKLADERDALGMRRLRLDWQLNDLDKRTFARAISLMMREAPGQDVGRFWLRPSLRCFDFDRHDSVHFEVPVPNPRYPNQVDTELRWGCHHMGTTRMHSDPRKGVVDSNLRVHGAANLYIAGSSVFPACGVSNPTLTIIALALRLADHIKATTRAD
jgi:choline dehydrogenase-like flavoprotein